MPLQTDLNRATAVIEALDLPDLDGLQILTAAPLETAHHPPLNPDWPALLLGIDTLPAAHLGRVLANQYPAEHPLRLVQATGDANADARYAVTPCAGGTLGDVSLAGQWSALYVPALPQPSSFEAFQEIIAHLRAPEGCPWDREQTHESLRPYLLEETYEVLDALDSGDINDLREELGDLLLQSVLHSQIAVEAGEFRMADVLAGITAKIVRRHPHVWGDVSVENDQEVKVNWDKLKQAEKNGTRQSRLDGVSKALPALSQAWSYQDRAARVGFDWDTIAPVIDKVREELDELLEAQDASEREGEVGDLLFAAVNLARWLDVDPESALRRANARFYGRFSYIEQQAARQGRDLDKMTLDDMDALWDEAKTRGL